MAVAENVERVYPTRSELEKESQQDVACPVVGCLKIFRQSSALRFHLVKLHRLILNESDARLAQHLKPQTKKLYEYYCPEANCRFSCAQEQKFFHSYQKLKQHFMRLHAPQSLVCSTCGKTFGLGYDLTRHAGRCHQKPWCSSCGLCMGSWETLAQHVRETGHEGAMEQHSDNVNNVQIIDKMRGKELAKECSDSTGLSQEAAAVQSQTTVRNNGSCNVETGITKNTEPEGTIEASDQITQRVDIIPSGESREIIQLETPSDLPLSSESKTENTADQSNRETVTSKSTDVGPFSRKKRSRLARPERETSRKTILLPASNLIVIPSSVGTMFFYTVPVQPSKSTLQRLAPRQSLTQELDSFATSGFSPVAGERMVTDGCTSGMSTRDLTSLDTARESVSTQTRSRRIRVAETQTTEGYVLKKSLGVYSAPLSRQSCGSQVSPRARVKRPNVQSTHTQTSSRTVHHARRHKPTSVSVKEPVFQSVVPTTAPTDAWPDFVHNETQTMALLQELQASLAESSSTQTLESYLFDNFPNENCIDTLSNETGRHRDSVFATIGAESNDLFDSVTRVAPIAEGPPVQGISNASGSDYGLFSSEFPNEDERNRCKEQCNSFLINDEMFVRDFHSTGTGPDGELLTRQKTFTAETQTIHPDCLTDFLTAASQTNDFVDLMSTNTETQTVDDDFFMQFWSHMETQTTDEFLTELGFSDTETQTTWVFGEDVRPLQPAPRAAPPELQGAVLLDMETQTCFQ